MAYPTNIEGAAQNVAVDPALQSQFLNGVTNLEQAFATLDDFAGVDSRRVAHMLTHPVANVVAGAWAIVAGAAAAGYLYRGYLGNDATKALNDAVEIDLYVASTGTYRLALNCPQMSDAPILKVYIDTVQVGVVAGYDLYAAAVTPQTCIGIDDLALTAGVHRIRFLCADKNAASAFHLLRLQAISLKRTA